MGIIHTNLASLYKYHEDLEIVLSTLKFDFHITRITEHKIRDTVPVVNIDIPDCHKFAYNTSLTIHGLTGFYIKDSLQYKVRRDLKLIAPSPGEFESTFIEIIVPGKKNLIVGCIYRHPSSTISIEEFSKEYLDPTLEKISVNNKICSTVGDFNIDLLKIDSHNDINMYYNTFISNIFAPFILQPTRPNTKTLIDNIFLNTIDYNTYSGNLYMQLADHLIPINHSLSTIYLFTR